MKVQEKEPLSPNYKTISMRNILINFLKYLLKTLGYEEPELPEITPHSYSEVRIDRSLFERVDFHIKSNKYQRPRHYYDHSSMLEDFKRDVLSQLEENFFFYFPVKQHHNRMEGSIEYQTTLYFLPDNN